MAKCAWLTSCVIVRRSASLGVVLRQPWLSLSNFTRAISTSGEICRQYSKMSEPKRGSLIVLEGCDRSGKSTQCDLLYKHFRSKGRPVQLMKYPDRTSKIGHMINDYLTCKEDSEDHMVHLLFSANRWESVPTMLKLLQEGTTLIVDRYAFSGVAFTAAKNGFSIDWCKQPDIGLPRPDIVLYLTLSAEAAERRGGFGEERYEKTDFQKKVAHNFTKLQDDYWKVIDANKTKEALHEELVTECETVIEQCGNKPILKLWTDGAYTFA